MIEDENELRSKNQYYTGSGIQIQEDKNGHTREKKAKILVFENLDIPYVGREAFLELGFYM
jgi:hypothetical protein